MYLAKLSLKIVGEIRYFQDKEHEIHDYHPNTTKDTLERD